MIMIMNYSRSRYIVDWRMVMVEGGHVLHHVKREEELSRKGNCSGNMCGGEYVQEEKCPDPTHADTRTKASDTLRISHLSVTYCSSATARLVPPLQWMTSSFTYVAAATAGELMISVSFVK